MVNRYPENGNGYYEQSSRFSDFSRHSSGNQRGYEEEYPGDNAFIYYRPSSNAKFEGPFTENQVQFWYKESYFFNTLEFRFGEDGPIETLQALKDRNGKESPFGEYDDQAQIKWESAEKLMGTLIGRIGDIATDVLRLREEKKEGEERIAELVGKVKDKDEYRAKSEAKITELTSEMEQMKELVSILKSNEEAKKKSEEDNEKENVNAEYRKTNEAQIAQLKSDLEEEKKSSALIRVDSEKEIGKMRSEAEIQTKSMDEYRMKTEEKMKEMRTEFEKMRELISERIIQERSEEKEKERMNSEFQKATETKIGQIRSDMEKLNELVLIVKSNTLGMTESLEAAANLVLALKTELDIKSTAMLKEREEKEAEYRLKLQKIEESIESLKASRTEEKKEAMLKEENEKDSEEERREGETKKEGADEDTDVSITQSTDEMTEMRTEIEGLHQSVNRLDKFTFKLSHKVEKQRNLLNQFEQLGEGLVKEHGVYCRLDIMEVSLEDLKERVNEMVEEKKEEVVLPVEREVEKEEEKFPSTPLSPELSDVWFSPRQEFAQPVQPLQPAAEMPTLSFAAAAESIAAFAAAAFPEPAAMVERDTWEAIDSTVDEEWGEEEEEEEEEEEREEEEEEEEKEEEREKEKEEEGEKGEAALFELLGNGLPFLLEPVDETTVLATDAIIDKLSAAIKGARMLHIAVSLSHHFVQPMMCTVCSVELKNAIEYFEHLNRSHFKKCGGADSMFVQQFAHLLEQFQAARPQPISIAKKQFVEREKKKPWLKREVAAPAKNGKKNNKRVKKAN